MLAAEWQSDQGGTKAETEKGGYCQSQESQVEEPHETGSRFLKQVITRRCVAIRTLHAAHTSSSLDMGRLLTLQMLLPSTWIALILLVSSQMTLSQSGFQETYPNGTPLPQFTFYRITLLISS